MDIPTQHVQLASFRLHGSNDSYDDIGQDQSLESAEDHASLNDARRERLVDHFINVHIGTAPSADAKTQEKFLLPIERGFKSCNHASLYAV